MTEAGSHSGTSHGARSPLPLLTLQLPQVLPPSLALPLPVELPNSLYWKQPPKTWWTAKRSFRVAEPDSNEPSEHWFEHADKKAGSWWPDWLAWQSARCGPMVEAPQVDAKTYPKLGPAPGTYVFEQ